MNFIRELRSLGDILVLAIKNGDAEVKRNLFEYIMKVSEFCGYCLSVESEDLWTALDSLDMSIIAEVFESERFNYLRHNKVAQVALTDFNCNLADKGYSFHQPEFFLSHVTISKFPGREDDRFAVDVLLEPNRVYHSTVDGKVVGVNHLPVDRDLKLMEYVETLKESGEALPEELVKELFQIQDLIDEYALGCTIKYYRDYLKSNYSSLNEYVNNCNAFLSDREGYGFDLNSKVVEFIIQKKSEGVEQIVESDIEGFVESSVSEQTLKILNDFLVFDVVWSDFFASRSLAKHLSNSVEVLDEQGVTHLFSHVELAEGVEVGVKVRVGDDLYKISYNSGDSTVPHLHYSAFTMDEVGEGQKVCQPVPLVDEGHKQVPLYRTNLPGFDRYLRRKSN